MGQALDNQSVENQLHTKASSGKMQMRMQMVFCFRKRHKVLQQEVSPGESPGESPDESPDKS